VVPLPSLLSTAMAPLCTFISSLQRMRPNPLPGVPGQTVDFLAGIRAEHKLQLLSAETDACVLNLDDYFLRGLFRWTVTLPCSFV
jgi:hypothetical protein